MSSNAAGSGRGPRTRRTIYLVRHAIAAPRGEKHPDDTKRPLTHRGVARMRQAVRGFAILEPGLDLVLASPLVRARHTAEILLAGLSPTPVLETYDLLGPGHAPADVAGGLGSYAARRAVALVGHEPDLGGLAAWLIGAGEPLAFKKGGIARIDVAAFPPGRDGRLVWLATPRMLRGLA